MSEGDEFGWSTELGSVRPRRHALPAADRPLLSRRAARELAERLAAGAELPPTAPEVELPATRRHSAMEAFGVPAAEPPGALHWQTGPVTPVVDDAETSWSWVPTEHWTTAELVAVVEQPETDPAGLVEPVGAPQVTTTVGPTSGLTSVGGATAPRAASAQRRILETGPLRFDTLATADPWATPVAVVPAAAAGAEEQGQDELTGAAPTQEAGTGTRRRRATRAAGPEPASPDRAAPRSGRKAPNPGRNLPQAIAVGVGLAGAVLLSLLVRKEAFVALAAASVVVGVWELSHAMSHRKLHIPVIPLAVGSVGMLVSAFVARGEGLFAALMLTAFGVLLWRLIDGVQGAARDVAAGVFAAVYVPFLAGWAIIMLAAPDGAQRVIVYVATVVASDVGGYAAGVLFGRHPMSPSISPKKSWEGFAGSVLVCALVGTAGITLLLHGPWWAGAVLGPVVAVTATAGDLCESLIKRDLGVKDMGTVLPGHGGIMDRLDSMLFSAPAVHLLLLLLVSSTT